MYPTFWFYPKYCHPGCQYSVLPLAQALEIASSNITIQKRWGWQVDLVFFLFQNRSSILNIGYATVKWINYNTSNGIKMMLLLKSLSNIHKTGQECCIFNFNHKNRYQQLWLTASRDCCTNQRCYAYLLSHPFYSFRTMKLQDLFVRIRSIFIAHEVMEQASWMN